MDTKKAEGFELESLETDPQKELEGVWFDMGKGARVKVARHGNKKYTAMLRRLAKQNRVTLEAEDDVSFELSETMTIEVYAHTILLDWEGIKIGGEFVKYTPELGVEVLTKLKDFRERIQGFAQTVESYRVKHEDKVLDT